MEATSPQDSFSIDLAIQKLGSSPGLGHIPADLFPRDAEMLSELGLESGELSATIGEKSCEEQGQPAPQGPGLIFFFELI